MAVTKKRFFSTVAIAYILDVGLSASMQFFRLQTIDWGRHLVFGFFFVGFLLLMSWLMGDITFKKKGDTK